METTSNENKRLDPMEESKSISNNEALKNYFEKKGVNFNEDVQKKLKEIGVKEVNQLRLCKEEELVSFGFSIIQSREILEEFCKLNFFYLSYKFSNFVYFYSCSSTTNR